MANLHGMQVFDCLHHLNENVPSFIFIEASILVDSIEQFSSLAQVIHKVEIAVVFIGLVQFIDVGVIEETEDVDLIFEDIGVFDEPFVDDFDAPFSVGRLFECGLINCSISSASDGLNY